MKLRYSFGKVHNILRFRRKVLGCFGGGNKGFVKVLVYHDIPGVKLSRFCEHIKCLHNNYTFITPEQFHTFMAGNMQLSGLNLLLSFDDGFLSSRIAAEKALGPLGIKALFFVTVNFIGLSDEQQWKLFASNRMFNGKKQVQQLGPEYAPMSWQDLLWLQDNGHSIGSHSLNHSRLTENFSVSEIVKSGSILREKLGTNIYDFAYPFGDIESICPKVITQIQKRYKYCFSGVRGLNTSLTHPMGILRDPVDLDDPVAYLRFQVENGLSWLYRKKTKVLNDFIKIAQRDND
ncbi:MAG: polysaccharide deacetylase family protein [Sedimentisphaerales bacterium]